MLTQSYDPVSVILLNIDGFKSVNDSFGSRVGDAVLAELASAPPNSVGRYGGEELSSSIREPLQLLPCSSQKASARVVSTVVSLTNGAHLTLSASLGSSHVPDFRKQVKAASQTPTGRYLPANLPDATASAKLLRCLSSCHATLSSEL